MGFSDEEIYGEAILDRRQRVFVDLSDERSSEDQSKGAIAEVTTPSHVDASSGIFFTSRIGIEYVGIVYVGDPDNEDTHFSSGPMDHARGNMNHRPGMDLSLFSIKKNRSSSLQNIIELRGALVVV